MELDTIVVGDCLDIMADMPDGCVDLVFLDGPYGLSKDDWDKFDSYEQFVKFYIPVFHESRRILKTGGSLYICGIAPQIHFLTSILVRLFDWQSEIIWVVNNPQGTGVKKWVRATETILFVSKGKPHFNKDAVRIPHAEHYRMWAGRYQDSTVSRALYEIKRGSPYGLIGNKRGYRCHPNGRVCENAWLFQVPHGAVSKNGRHGHITEKPEGLMERIILASSNQRNLVFDPFIGSGTTAVAALKLGRHFYGCDINPEYVKLANERIEKARLETAQLELL